MKKNVLVVSVMLLLSVAACKSKAKATATSSGPQPTSDPTVYKGVTNDSCAVEMSFGSYGAGIDGTAYETAINLINGRRLLYTAKGIGREGEVRLCMALNELKSKEKTEFIEQLKKIAAGGKLVSVSIR